jgi:hypothetical protein
MAPLLDEKALEEYTESLSHHGTTITSAETLAEVPAWFDEFESRTENPVSMPIGT